MGTVAVILLLLTLLLAGLLGSALRVEALLHEDARFVRVRWLALAFGYDLRTKTATVGLGSRDLYRAPRGGEGKDRGEPQPRGEGPGPRRGGAVVRGLLRERRAFGREVRYLFRHAHIDRLDAECTFGTEDPATTGALYGFASAVANPLAGSSANVRVRLVPDFMEERFEGRLDARASIRIVHLLVLGLRADRLRRRLVPHRR